MNRIKELREVLEMTQEKFSQKLGLARNTIANYECGRRDPTNQVLVSICREFNVNEEWLRTGKGEIFKELTVYEELMKDYQMDDIGKLLFQIYSEMTPDEKKVISDKVRQIAKIIVENDL